MSDLARQYRETRDRLGPDHPDTIEAFEARQREALAEEFIESDGVASQWWLSFTDPEIAATIPEEEQVPGGRSFLGVCIVDGFGMIDAVNRAHFLGVNPGGQVSGFVLPAGSIAEVWCDRLLTADEALAIPEPGTEG